MDILLRRTLTGLEPVDEYNSDKLRESKIAIGSICKAKITQPRNLEFHRFFFAMLNETFAMQDVFDTMDQWRAVCITGAGHCDFVKGRDGSLVAIPKSIAFANMDEVAFRKLKEDVLTFICDRYLPASAEDLIAMFG